MTKLVNSVCFALIFTFSISLFADDIQRVRIDVTTPNNYVRHLLLGFTPDDAATDGFDYGYDAPNPDNYPDDASWIINDQQYVIQGVGCFNISKQYPLGLFLSNSGEIKIDLNSLENFDEEINVYVYDAVLNTYQSINDSSFNYTMLTGTYDDRFFITFSNNILSVNDVINPNNVTINYSNNSNELFVKSSSIIESIEIFNIIGKKITDLRNINAIENKYFLSIKNQIVIVNVTTINGTLSKKVLIH